jgi:hypothetical protein
MTVTLPYLALKLLFGDTHRHIVTHGYHNVKLLFHISEKQNSYGIDFDGDTSSYQLEQGQELVRAVSQYLLAQCK